MHAKAEPRIPWREREFLSVSDAAVIAGRSRTWVDNQVVAGELEARRLPTGGPLVITVASLCRIVDAAEPCRVVPFTERAAAKRLRLVVNNP